MRIGVLLLFTVALQLAGCTSEGNIASYTDFAHLTFRTDARSVELNEASSGAAMTQFTRKYTLKNNAPMHMHVRVPPLAVVQKLRSSVSQVSQNNDAFWDIAEAFGENRIVTLAPGQEYDFEITSSWFLASEASPDDITTTFVFGLPDKHATGLELIGEVTATPRRTEP